MRTKPAPLIPENTVARAPKAPVVPMKPAEPMKWFRVKSGPSSSRNPGEIGPFRRDQGDYFLKQGNEINSAQYDIRMLKNAGVVLEDIDPPGWWVKAQEDSAEKVEQLRADGVDIGDSAPVDSVVPRAAAAAGS